MDDPIFGNEGWASRWSSQILSVLRIVTALLFLQHGMTKMLGIPPSSASHPSEWSILWMAGMLELVGSVLLLVGFLSRPVAFLLSGEMAVAYWLVHAPEGTYPMLNGGEAAVLFCFIFLYIAFEGPGPWSIDAKISARRSLDGPDSYYELRHADEAAD